MPVAKHRRIFSRLQRLRSGAKMIVKDARRFGKDLAQAPRWSRPDARRRLRGCRGEAHDVADWGMGEGGKDEEVEGLV